MLELNYKNRKDSRELRRLAALAEVDTKELSEITGLNESTINKYFTNKRQNYLFQFALEYLAQQRLEEIKTGEDNEPT